VTVADFQWVRGEAPKDLKLRYREFRKGFHRIAVPPLNKFAGELRKELTGDITGSRQGKALFGSGGKGGAVGKLKMGRIAGRFSRTESAWIAGGKMGKFAGWIAGDGGRTKSAGKVTPRKSKRLSFYASRYGKVISVKEITHRGARVRGHNFAERRLSGLRGRFLSSVSRHLLDEYRKRVAR